MSLRTGSVTHVSSVHPWTDNRVHYRECVSLAESGFDVTLIAVDAPVEGHKTQVKLVLLPRRRRAKRMIISSAQAIVLALLTRAAVIHLHDPELVPYIPLLRAAGRKVVYDAHEDLPDQIFNKPYIPKRLLAITRVLCKAVLRVAKTSDLIVCATDKIAEPFQDQAHAVIRNYPRLRPEEQDDRQTPVLERPNSVVYVGAITEARCAQVMVNSCDSNSFPDDWTFQLAGKASEELLKTLKTRAGWRRVEFHGVIPPSAARDLLLHAKIGLVVLEDNDAHRAAFPAKMFEYFAAGVPVIASDFPLWRKILVDRSCGLVVDPTSPDQIAAAIRRYAETPALLEEHSRNARRLALEVFNWESESRHLVDSYRNTLKIGPLRETVA